MGVSVRTMDRKLGERQGLWVGIKRLSGPGTVGRTIFSGQGSFASGATVHCPQVPHSVPQTAMTHVPCLGNLRGATRHRGGQSETRSPSAVSGAR